MTRHRSGVRAAPRAVAATAPRCVGELRAPWPPRRPLTARRFECVGKRQATTKNKRDYLRYTLLPKPPRHLENPASNSPECRHPPGSSPLCLGTLPCSWRPSYSTHPRHTLNPPLFIHPYVLFLSPPTPRRVLDLRTPLPACTPCEPQWPSHTLPPHSLPHTHRGCAWCQGTRSTPSSWPALAPRPPRPRRAPGMAQTPCPRATRWVGGGSPRCRHRCHSHAMPRVQVRWAWLPRVAAARTHQ